MGLISKILLDDPTQDTLRLIVQVDEVGVGTLKDHRVDEGSSLTSASTLGLPWLAHSVPGPEHGVLVCDCTSCLGEGE